MPFTETRQRLFTRPVFDLFKRILPPLSQTEQEAMEAGDTWWDAELFAGKPNWNTLLQTPVSRLTSEEQAFLDNQVETLLGMLNDYQIESDRDMPQEVWDYLKREGFFALIIPKSFGGREFSAIANSTIVSRIATRSLSCAVTVMVPNSLGPAELLLHYGTDEQKQRWLPGLAGGTELPCFALTGPEAGSDAGSIPDSGVICHDEYQGEQVLGIRLNWSKRYITLAPVASVLGLAFKLFDPDGLLGENKNLGITCALIPTSHPGVNTGNRHDPLGLAFMNGTTTGKDVFIPIDWIIGGPDYAGKGWRMLVECLSAGRGISLPGLATANGHLAARMTGAYGYVRKQFGMSIGRFEGIQEALGRIGAFTYMLEGSRKLTATALDMGKKPAVITAIAKYHMTELSRKVVDDAMDVHAGRGIQMGEKNYLGNAYRGQPISITVEGANILTRNLMIFGQGATRCHPFVLGELEAAADKDTQRGLEKFDALLMKHLAFGTGNFFAGLWQGITGAVFNSTPVTGPTSKHYKQLTRMSRALALCADMSMLILGGDLKRREMISARLGDVLSHLYLASATLKFYEDQGRHADDLPFVDYAVTYCLAQCGEAFEGFFQNFDNRVVARALKLVLFPYGIRYRKPSDKLAQQISEALLSDSSVRERITSLCYIGENADDSTGEMERAFKAMLSVAPLEKKLNKARRDGTLPRKASLSELLSKAEAAGIISSAEVSQIQQAEALRVSAIQVNEFASLGEENTSQAVPSTEAAA